MDLYLSNNQRLSKNWFIYSDDRLEIMRKELRSEAKSHILNVPETEYKRYLNSKYELCPLRIYEDTIRIDEPVKTKHERSSLNEHERYPYYWLCSVACTIEGTVDLWGVIPTQYAFGGRPEFSASAKLLTFLFRINSMNADEYNQQKDIALKYLVGHTNYINSDVSRFNANLPSEIEIAFTKLKEEVMP